MAQSASLTRRAMDPQRFRPKAGPQAEQRMIRRAAFQKPRLEPIWMIRQRNFDCCTGFCRPLLSDRLI
jgi:hypothetical protein